MGAEEPAEVLSRDEIMKRYRTRMKEEGKDQASYWVDAQVIEDIKKLARETNRTTSDFVNEVLKKALKNV